MIIFPENKSLVELNKYEKMMLNSFEKSLDDSYVCLLGINPSGLDDNRCIVLLTDSSLDVFKVDPIPLDNDNAFNTMYELLFKNRVLDSIEIIRNKLKLNKRLTNDYGELNFSVAYYLVLPNLSEELAISIKNKDIANHFIFTEQYKELCENYMESLKSIRNKHFDKTLNREMKNLVIQRIAPEYTIPKYGIIENNLPVINLTNENIMINELDRMAEIYMLDNDQINIVNNLLKGEQLILACAGSGKSVLLISKAYKIASILPSKSILILCYNRKLKEYYNWQIAVAGFKEKNVNCKTIFQLCQELLTKYKINFPRRPKTQEDYDEIFNKANNALLEGIIKERYFGIFIDEIQIFKPEWYKFCYSLLENNTTEEHVFVVCGDISQNINKNIKRGKAPWQGDNELPSFRGKNKSIRIEKNYRNTIQINEFVNEFSELALKKVDDFNFKLDNRDDFFLRGKATRTGDVPVIINCKTQNNDGEAQAIIEAIEYMRINKKLPYTDICIILFNKTYRAKINDWNSKFYDVHENLKLHMGRENIPYSDMTSNDNGQRIHYADRDGVTIISCQSALGLDFKGVIFAGLRPMGQKFKTKLQSDLEKDDELNSLREEDFLLNINTIYTTCTRAREQLVIILSEKDKDSIYAHLFNKALFHQKLKKTSEINNENN